VEPVARGERARQRKRGRELAPVVGTARRAAAVVAGAAPRALLHQALAVLEPREDVVLEALLALHPSLQDAVLVEERHLRRDRREESPVARPIRLLGE